MTKIIAIVNQKGGDGKTTTAVNLSAALAIFEKKTLLVDFDPQGNASSGIGVEQSNPNIYEALIGKVDIAEIIQQSKELDCLYVASSNVELSGAEIELVKEFSREYKLKGILDKIKSQYDYILIDCHKSCLYLLLNHQ